MPTFTYHGPSRVLVLGGRRLTRGEPVELTGRAADIAASHPDVVKGTAEAAAQPTALDDIAAYLESGATDVGELTTKLIGLEPSALRELADEYNIALDPVEDPTPAGPAIGALALAMLTEDLESAQPGPEPLTGKALDERAAELEIEGRASMSADEKREAIAAREAEQAAEGGR